MINIIIELYEYVKMIINLIYIYLNDKLYF